MNIRDELGNLYGTTNPVLEFEYDESVDPDTSTFNKVGIRDVKDNKGYFDVIGTRYTQTEQPYVKKSGDAMTGELTNTTSFDGGFAIQNRPRLG